MTTPIPSNILLIITTTHLSLLLSLLLLLHHQPTKTLAAFTTSTTTSALSSLSSSSNNNNNIIITPGTKLPDIDLHWGFNPVTKVNLPQYTSSQSVLIVGTPAAFVIPPPTVSSSSSYSSSSRRRRQLPSIFDYLSRQQTLMDELFIDNVIHYSVNDGAAVGVWNQKILKMFDGENKLVTMMGDPSGALTKACGMEMGEGEDDDFFGSKRGFLGRCRPFVLYVVNNVVRCVIVGDEDEDDDDGKDVTIDDVMGVIRREREEEEMKRQKELSQQQERERESSSSSASSATSMV